MICHTILKLTCEKEPPSFALSVSLSAPPPLFLPPSLPLSLSLSFSCPPSPSFPLPLPRPLSVSRSLLPVRNELEQANSDLLEAVERGEALQAQLACEEEARRGMQQRLEEVEEEGGRMNALLEDTSRENVELSMLKEELVKMRPEREALHFSLDACMRKL